MDAWIVLTIAAAFLQNIRNGLQKSLSTLLSAEGAAYTRFVYGLPLAIVYWGFLKYFINDEVTWDISFWLYCCIGGVAQILAMIFLLRAFAIRGFAIGTSYAKTETLQTILFSIIILNETITLMAFFGIVISLIGVFFLSVIRKKLEIFNILISLKEKTAVFGLTSAALLGLSAVSYRAAALSMDSKSYLLAGGSTLMVTLLLQTILMTLYLLIMQKGQITKVWDNRGKAMLVGLTSMLGSVGWFTAMTLQNAAYVRALGQVEIIFTFLTSIIIFKEQFSKFEIYGALLIIGGVILLLIG
jgi:drug/metabolite transporter (DMT)-like permease